MTPCVGPAAGYRPRMILVYACSLNPSSRSAVLAERLRAALVMRGAAAEVVDLRQHPLPLCDGVNATGGDRVAALAERAAAAEAVVLAAPIYNYGVNAACKNLVEWIGRSWAGKPVGLMAAAGGRSSYMALMPMANSLQLDFRCALIPRFVYATGADFTGEGADPEIGEGVRERVDGLAEALLAAVPAAL